MINIILFRLSLAAYAARAPPMLPLSSLHVAFFTSTI